MPKRHTDAPSSAEKGCVAPISAAEISAPIGTSGTCVGGRAHSHHEGQPLGLGRPRRPRILRGNRFGALLSDSDESDAGDRGVPEHENESEDEVHRGQFSGDDTAVACREPCAAGTSAEITQTTHLRGVVERLGRGVEIQTLRPPYDATSEPAVLGKLIKLDYVGFLFGKTNKDGTPRSFDSDQVDFVIGRNQMIDGFDRGVVGMRTGECRRIFIPWKQAYGVRGHPPKIPPRANLVFEARCMNIGADWNDDCRKGAVDKRMKKVRKQQRKQRKQYGTS